MSKLNEKIKNFKNRQLEKHHQDIAERRKYLQFCITEAERIFDALTNEILNDIGSFGMAIVNVISRYDNIFIPRISGLVNEKFKTEGLEIKLFNSIGIVQIFIK